jgi:hypothetical protein
MFRKPQEHNNPYLAWIRTQPCCLCGRTNVEAAHIRTSSLEHGKEHTGMQQKSSDRWALPLCHEHHVEQHGMNEREFWASNGVANPAELALKYQVMVR